MENKKLIKKIKKKALRQFETDLKNSVLKELYGNEYKKQIKKIRKQILQEMQEELFGTSNALETDSEQTYSAPEFIHTNTVDENEFTIKSSEEKTSESKEQEEVPAYESEKIVEYKGFKFDRDRMSAIVTGKTRNKAKSEGGDGVERIENRENDSSEKKDTSYFLPGFPGMPQANTSLNPERLRTIEDIKSGEHKEKIKKSVESDNLSLSFLQGLDKIVPATENMVKYDYRLLTPSTKEDLTFFLGKLKNGISKLGKGEKNINYRHSKDDIYALSYNKDVAGADGFTLNFDIDLNIKTLGATIKDFKFAIDGFRFDSSFFDLIDVVSTLQIVGMDIIKYVNEITEINHISAPLVDNTSTKIIDLKFNPNTKIEGIINDMRIVKILNNNDISNYGELLKFKNNYTAIKGIGEKTSEKIKKLIK